MPKILLTLLTLTVLSGCGAKTIPIKGSYIQSPFSISTDKSFENVWDKIIDLFVLKGYSIKIVDKNSGLITSERVIVKVTVEKKNKELLDSKAFIVVPQIYEPGPNRYTPITKNSDITGEWNIRIRTVQGKTVVDVNVVNLKYQFHDTYYRTYREEILSNYKSTGVFERTIADLIK